MSKRVKIPKYEQMILDIGQMKAEELEVVIRCAKAKLADMRPKVRKPKAPLSQALTRETA